MRHIQLLDNPPPNEWLDKAQQATAELEAEPNAVSRLKLIKRKSQIWKDLKDHLLTLSNQKCWYSEALDCFQHWDVEHFRPKSRARNLDGVKREGYWWLSFAWQNLRVCGRVGNIAKSTFFPVKSGFTASSTNRDIDEELPYLLDPVIVADCALLSFDLLGEAVPAPGVAGWNEERVRVSIDKYELNFDKLVLGRLTVWQTCTSLLNELQNLMQDHSEHPGAAKRARIEEKMKQLVKLADRKSPFSSTATACLSKSEIGWASEIASKSY